METDSFYKLLIKEILNNISNQYYDNYDYYRFGVKKTTWKQKVKNAIKKKYNLTSLNHIYDKGAFIWLFPYLDGLMNLYEILSDENSKKLLIKLITYRILGNEKYKLPLSTPDYWKGIAELDKLRNPDDKLLVKFPGSDIYIYKFNLNQVGIPMEIYYSAKGIYDNIKIKQYEYEQDNILIKVEKEDIVLDCGACWGDTALFFANDLETNGHVYSFEFIPGNIHVFEQNMNINPDLKKRITIIPYPLDEKSGNELFYSDNGPASKVSSLSFPEAQKVETINIYDAVDKYQLKKVDFIKMDIEGSELPALKGGINAITKYRPKLAISIYHSMDDFVNIAQYLKSLNLGYDFYLKHGTIHHEETVLLAIASNK